MKIRTMAFILPAMLGASLIFTASVAKADTILGRPVTSIGSNTQAVPNCPSLEGQVCYSNPQSGGNGAIGFYIPLSSSADGTYGVTNIGGGRTAGTTVDYGDGKSNALTIYLQFFPINLPIDTASLKFDFTDLDLRGVNDPYKFFETVQFFSATGSALAPTIYKDNQSGTTPLTYYVDGNLYSQSIYFPDVTSIILNNPFYVKLTFGSDWNQHGNNTPESLIATLTTTAPSSPPPAVPEPATLVLLGSGIASLVGVKKRNSMVK